ncbi:hypothetical protein AVL62_13460 [Serinicoccus chungangensis]|uniref:AAA+ ATPase domain-containing protein n=1 Tax=Serinicoccus chungangensis TaxID=767452 RepID=A0A0W8IBU4_9MICO|nr:ATP-binding protein [Serinicoccus chungangensis]KUG57426.1 hypothetical protein AVL62_13460 [Serinicoccus chungangensis]
MSLADTTTTAGATAAPSAPPAGVTASQLIRAEIEVLRQRLLKQDTDEAERALAELREAYPGQPPLDDVEAGFGLSRFERAAVVFAAAPDLVGSFGSDLSRVLGGRRPTLSTALAVLPDPHWDAVLPQSPLRHWRLLEGVDAAAPLDSPVRLAECVLHYLVGVDAPDADLTTLSMPVEPVFTVPPSLREVAYAVIESWDAGRAVAVTGAQSTNAHLVGTAAARMAGLAPRRVAAADLPADGPGFAEVRCLMTRQTVLSQWAWVIDATDADLEHLATLGRALAASDAPTVVVLGPGRTLAQVPSLTVPRLGPTERGWLWQAALQAVGVEVDQAEIDAVAGSHDLSVDHVVDAAHDVALGMPLRTACRRRHRHEVGTLATVRTPQQEWADLVLPDPIRDQIGDLVASLRHRGTVLEEWGFGRRGRGLGTTALFAGPSGTGKTLAAEVIAHEVGLDLVQVDLSQVVNKYIGETEKHLGSLFDAAEDGGMVLLFDEADALFGKRSEVKDSHDRYANLEVGYLLQRLEAFTGLAILTTNARSHLDRAFTRRLSTIITFPYPETAARRRLWQVSLPDGMPRGEIDLDRLAALDLTGGDIAAAALRAAYRAADAGVPVTTEHLRDAARVELGKSGRTAPRERR